MASDFRGSWWRRDGGITVILALICFFVRMQNLSALPIFGDEAIYLRWAQLIRAGNWWVSLADPKPPLHFWLMALVMECLAKDSDPLWGARLISAAAGALSIPALMAVCGEIGALGRRGESLASGRVVGMLAGVLLIFCPYLAFFQRLATADSLFIFEMLIVIWLALRWARRLVAGENAWRAAIAFGVSMGAAMLTRQGFSYVLWAVPIVAAALGWRAMSGKRIRNAGLQAVAAVVIAGMMWLPYLIAQFNQHAADRGGTYAELHVRILYQEQFTQGNRSHGAIALHNAGATFVPTWDVEGNAAGGWLWFYMTPPLYMASLFGLIVLALRREWRILIFLKFWIVLVLGPVILFGTVLRSRYVVAGTLPLLVTAGYFIAEWLGLLMVIKGPLAVRWTFQIVSGIGLAALLILPMRNVGLQSTQWWKQPLTISDRYEYITGWTAGSATIKAVNFIRGYAEKIRGQNASAENSLVVITDNGWGLPADGIWTYFSGGRIPGVDVYYTSRAGASPILIPAEVAGNTYILRKNKWLYTPAEPVRFPSTSSILYITGNQGGGEEGDRAVIAKLEQLNPNLKPVATFYGIDGEAGPDHVLLFELR